MDRKAFVLTLNGKQPVIFDEARAWNVWHDEMGQPGEAHGKIMLTDENLERIARKLARGYRINNPDAQIVDGTIRYRPAEGSRPNEVYAVIPEGASIDGKVNSQSKVLRMNSQGSDRSNRASIIASLSRSGYSPEAARDIGEYLTGVDASKGSVGMERLRTAAAIAAIVLGALYANHALNGGDTKETVRAMHQAAQTPGTNMYNAIHGK